MSQLSNGIKITRVLNAVAAGVSVQTSTAVDMAGFDGVRFIVALGAGAAGSIGQVKAQQCDTVGGSYNDITGSGGAVFTPTTDDNKVYVLDVLRPARRFVRCVVLRGTGNTVIDAVIAEQYGGRRLPASDDATTGLGRRFVLSAPDGTA